MVDAVAVSGNEEQVTEGLRGLLEMGAAEVMASPVAAGPDREESLERTMGLAGPAFSVSGAVVREQGHPKELRPNGWWMATKHG